MSIPFTSVVSYHTNEFGCGVAKFSKELAKRLGVPFVGLDGVWGEHPLLSLKASEFHSPEMALMHLPVFGAYSLFWHDKGIGIASANAKCVYYADPSLGQNGLWCPSLLPEPTPRPIKLFAFGMAHKMQFDHFAKVRQLLEADGHTFHLRVSVGLHEGTSLSDAMTRCEYLKHVMGYENVTILGLLSDDAVNLELQDAEYVLAFFEQGLRANNTTVHAAYQAGKKIITNHDAQTPGYLKAITTNILTRDEWDRTVGYRYTWENLIREMEEIYAATVENRQPSHLG